MVFVPILYQSCTTQRNKRVDLKGHMFSIRCYEDEAKHTISQETVRSALRGDHAGHFDM